MLQRNTLYYARATKVSGDPSVSIFRELQDGARIGASTCHHKVEAPVRPRFSQIWRDRRLWRMESRQLGNSVDFKRNRRCHLQPTGCFGDVSVAKGREHNIHLRASPAETELLLSSIYRLSSYLTGNTTRLRYRVKSVNAVWGNSRCLL
jgi:hypothetical protein